MRQVYLHTLMGRPAYFDGDQVVFASGGGYSRDPLQGPVPDLRTLRRQQQASITYRLSNSFEDRINHYGYVRLYLPEREGKPARKV